MSRSELFAYRRPPAMVPTVSVVATADAVAPVLRKKVWGNVTNQCGPGKGPVVLASGIDYSVWTTVLSLCHHCHRASPTERIKELGYCPDPRCLK